MNDRMVIPSGGELAHIEELIVRYVTSGSGETVIRFLIKNFSESGGKKDHVSSEELLKVLPNSYRPDALGSLMRNLRRKVPRLFVSGPGRNHPIKAWIDPARGNYAIHFGVNAHDAEVLNLASVFWQAYLVPERPRLPVRVFYPEPQFFRDRKDTYIRNPSVTTKDDIQLLAYLRPDGELRESFSFVPAGIVRAMIMLNDYFQPKGVTLASTPVRPTEFPEDEDEDVVVLGTPTSNGMISLKETDLPLQVTADAVCFPIKRRRGHKIFCQPGERLRETYTDERNDSVVENKWGVVTRCEHIAGRTMTIISAKHGRTVQALVRFLTHGDELKRLFARVREDDAEAILPTHFQALFQVETTKKTGEARIGAIHVKVVVDLSRNSNKHQSLDQRKGGAMTTPGLRARM